VLKTRRIPRTLSALLLVELSIQGFYWIFATLAHAQNKSWCSRTNPDTRVPHFLVKLVFTLRGQKEVWRNTRASLGRELPLGVDFHRYLPWALVLRLLPSI